MTNLVSSELIAKLNSLPDFLAHNIMGQDVPLQEISALLRRSFCGCRLPNKPVCSMLLAGPTGVGKTEVANLVAEHLGLPLVRLDMSEFMTVDSIHNLKGTHYTEGVLSYYNNESDGLGALLFDEIEKAHPLILDVFLQILSAARFTRYDGTTLDLSNYVVIATTNIGSRVLMDSKSTDRETIVTRTTQSVAYEMRPETFARFDLHCVFNKLQWKTLNQIASLHLYKAQQILKAQGHELEVNGNVIQAVCKEGYSEKFGARPMQNAAMRVLGDLVSAEMLKNGGQPVSGKISYDRRQNLCALLPLN
jgi:ATP-dependent Clp protease ATP-binding subunit ClpA